MENVEMTGQDMKVKAKEKADEMMRRTSKGIDRVMTYVRENDSQKMMSDLQEVVRKYPGRSLLVGVILGALVGRAMSR